MPAFAAAWGGSAGGESRRRVRAGAPPVGPHRIRLLLARGETERTEEVLRQQLQHGLDVRAHADADEAEVVARREEVAALEEPRRLHLAGDAERHK